MYERIPQDQESVFGYRITGKLTREELKQVTEELKQGIAEHGKVRVLIHLAAPPYAELGALWEDAKFSLQYMRDIERMAVVGTRPWQELWVRVVGMLGSAQVRYFDEADIQAAQEWVTS